MLDSEAVAWQSIWLFSRQSVVSQLNGSKTAQRWIFCCMILLLCLSFSSYVRVTLSLWVMLGIWHPASRHCLSKSTMHPFSHSALYRDNATKSSNPIQYYCCGTETLCPQSPCWSEKGNLLSLELPFVKRYSAVVLDAKVHFEQVDFKTQSTEFCC